VPLVAVAATPTVATTADETLVRRAAAGDAIAFDALVAARIDRCYRLAWSILSNEEDAADATQDAFVAAWRELPRLRDLSAFEGWLNRIVANSARMTRRHRVRLREVAVEPMDDGSPGEARPMSPQRPGRSESDQVVANDAIGRAFDRLRPADRTLLVLHHVEERPLAEIARSLGIPVGTVKWRLHSARSALERALEAEA
jgi:RNA polymerase sigma-70 factor (ECF subfamily)